MIISIDINIADLIRSIDIAIVHDQIVRMPMMTNLVDTTKKVNTAIQAKELLEHHIYIREINAAIITPKKSREAFSTWTTCPTVVRLLS